MRQIEGIFYTNLTDDLTQFIAKIRQKEIINEYTIFVIFCSTGYNYRYYKYWKSCDCVITITNDNPNFILFSNGKYKYLKDVYETTIDEFKKMCDNYDLLESCIKFTADTRWYNLNDRLYFYFYGLLVSFNGRKMTINDFIEKISTNYTEFYKYDYSQIKPANLM